MDSITAKYLEEIGKFSGLYVLAAASKGGVLNTYYANIIALYEAQTGGLVAGAGVGGFALTAGVPLITAVGVWVALGSGYYQAREAFKNENTLTGFSQGFAAAIAKWKWNHVADRFRRPPLRINRFDEGMDKIRVEYYHKGLQTGYLAGMVLPDALKKEYVRKIRGGGNSGAPSQWSNNEYEARNQQISYIIFLAAQALKTGIIKAE
ncbi:MAG TPA: hypothetical protein PKY59_20885 [Pyrinomonadaceae bacterium]|nr:hypothetical protein [Pyrinomonadaceae bacterium]